MRRRRRCQTQEKLFVPTTDGRSRVVTPLHLIEFLLLWCPQSPGGGGRTTPPPGGTSPRYGAVAALNSFRTFLVWLLGFLLSLNELPVRFRLFSEPSVSIKRTQNMQRSGGVGVLMRQLSGPLNKTSQAPNGFMDFGHNFKRN